METKKTYAEERAEEIAKADAKFDAEVARVTAADEWRKAHDKRGLAIATETLLVNRELVTIWDRIATALERMVTK